ncbi:hypothetical protein [Rhizobium herbae]
MCERHMHGSSLGMTAARDDLEKSEAILVTAIEVTIPERVIARTPKV